VKLTQPTQTLVLALLLSLTGCVGSGGDKKPKADDIKTIDFGIYTPDMGVESDGPSQDSPVGEGVLSDGVIPADGGSPNDTMADLLNPTDPSCAAFCTLYLQTCSNAQESGITPAYTNQEQCLSVCQGALWAEGTLEDTYVNTVGCRIHALQNDTLEGACGAGAPDGGNICGTACKNYCELSVQLCVGEYDTIAVCKGQCASMDDDGIVGVALGDTVQCRLQVLLDLATTEGASPDDYCPSAGVTTAGACALVPDCVSYCGEVGASCPAGSEYEQYTGPDTCTFFCEQQAKFDMGSFSTDPQNTVGCRMIAASKAQAAPALFCDMAGPSGGGECGDWCVNYCALAMETCTSENQLFVSVDECLASCPTVGSNGDFGDTKGNTIQCRYTLLYKALTGEIDKTQGCADAAVISLNTCFNPPEPPSCDEYCTNIMSACGAVGSSTSQYVNQESCLAYCDNETVMPIGFGGDKEGNTRGCRDHHAKMALGAGGQDPAAKLEFCTIAGPSGGEVCGTLAENYCQVAMAQCINAKSLYPSLEECLDIANVLYIIGTAPVETDDNLSCRFNLLAAGLASEEKGANCLEGSVYSKECLGPIDCFQYCLMVEAGCGGEDKKHPFGDGNNCEAYCTGNSDKLGLPFDEAVGTIGCRYSQAKIAVKNDDGANCEAAGPTGGGLCGSACDAYCDLAPVLCQNEMVLTPDKATCLEQCSTLPEVADEDTLYGNSVQCRLNALLTIYQGSGAPEACLEGSFVGYEKCLEGVTAPADTYVDDIQPILANHCAPCHGVGAPEPGSCNGNACFVTAYEDLKKPSYYCPGKTKGECMVVRMDDGSMPFVGTGPNDAELKTIQNWVLNGMLEQQ
jgi:hypothetical protein